MAQEIQAASPGQLAGDGAEAIAVGTVAAGVLAVATGQETVSPSAGSGAQEAEPHALVRLSFAIDPGAVNKTFTPVQVYPTGTPLAVTTVQTQDGFDINPTAQPAPNTMYVYTYTSA
jgi:hypothetical protein